MMRHPYTVEDDCRQRIAERHAEARRDALTATVMPPPKPAHYLSRFFHMLIALI